jgi:ribosomal protein S18 acetylase RimI-like enzyme
VTGFPYAARLRRPPEGLLRFDPGRDLPAVIELLREGFQHDLAIRDQRWLSDLQTLTGAGPLLSLLFNLIPSSLGGLTGFVWYDAGRLVANASLMRASDEIWVVANVVTRSDYRRRGIARELMAAVMASARERGASVIHLQVRRDNPAAQALYAGLGFRRLGARTYLHLAASDAAALQGEPAEGWSLLEWSGEDERSARRMMVRARGANWGATPGLVQHDIGHLGWQGRFEDWTHGRRTWRWAAAAAGEFRAVAVARTTEDGGPHQLELVTEPPWRGRVEGALVDACLSALRRSEARPVEAEVDAEETAAIPALYRAGFAEQRTLELLAFDLR